MATLHPAPLDGGEPREADADQWQSDPAASDHADTKGEDEALYGQSDSAPPSAQSPKQQTPQQPSTSEQTPSLTPPPQTSSASAPDPAVAAAAALYQQQQAQMQYAAQQQYLQQQAAPHQPPAPSPSASTGSKIFVGGLSWETDEDSLRRYFEQIGPVLDCVIMRDRHTGHPRGFGFVTFADDEAAGTAASRRHDLDGRQVEAKRAVPRNEGGGGATGMPAPQSGGTNLFGSGPRAQGQRAFPGDVAQGGMPSTQPGGHRAHHTTKCKVFVGGLPSSCGVDEFRAYFSQFGEVVDAQVMIDHNTGNSRGFGFVTFGSEAIVNTVVGPGKSNTDHEIMGKCVEVKRAEPKGASNERRSNRESYNAGVSGGGGGAMRTGTGSSNEAVPANSAANGGGTNAAAAAAAAYYSNYPAASLAEQYGAYYNNPQWQQYYAAMGYNFNAYPQGYNPYQQYLQAYMSNAASAANGSSGTAGMPANGTGDTASAPAGNAGGGK